MGAAADFFSLPLLGRLLLSEINKILLPLFQIINHFKNFRESIFFKFVQIYKIR